jgi:competence protein ComEA
MRMITTLLTAILAPAWLLAGPVDINKADAETLARELNGVGAARAQAIIDYRQQNGEFRKPEELLNVTGIGPAILEQNRDNIVIAD